MNKAYVVSSGAFVLFMASIILVNTFILSTHSVSSAYNNNMKIDFISNVGSDAINAIYDRHEYEIRDLLYGVNSRPVTSCRGGPNSIRAKISSGEDMRTEAEQLIYQIAGAYKIEYGINIEPISTLNIGVQVSGVDTMCYVDIRHSTYLTIRIPEFGQKSEYIEDIRYIVNIPQKTITRIPRT